jgi:hypothetical protein
VCVCVCVCVRRGCFALQPLSAWSAISNSQVPSHGVGIHVWCMGRNDMPLGEWVHCVDCVVVQCTGQKYQTVRRSYPMATVIGWVSGADGSLHLNSRDTTTVQPGSQLLFVARGVDDTLSALPEPYKVRLCCQCSPHTAPTLFWNLESHMPQGRAAIVASQPCDCSQILHTDVVMC